VPPLRIADVVNSGHAPKVSGHRPLPVEPPCDVCFEPVTFDSQTQRYSHTAPTWCRGIDGMVLAVPLREWDDLRRTRS
jgi:hypothetical protein